MLLACHVVQVPCKGAAAHGGTSQGLGGRVQQLRPWRCRGALTARAGADGLKESGGKATQLMSLSGWGLWEQVPLQGGTGGC